MLPIYRDIRAKQEITYFKARQTWKRNNTNWR